MLRDRDRDGGWQESDGRSSPNHSVCLCLSDRFMNSDHHADGTKQWFSKWRPEGSPRELLNLFIFGNYNITLELKL